MSQNITVAVRVRPLSQKEVGRGAESCLEVADDAEVICNDPDDKQLESLGGGKFASASFDGTIRCWDGATGRRKATAIA